MASTDPESVILNGVSNVPFNYSLLCTNPMSAEYLPASKTLSKMTQEHPDAITPQGPRSTQTPLQHKPPPGTQEHPDAIGLEGPRSTQMPLDQEDPGVTKRYWTRSTPDIIGPGDPRSTHNPLDQKDPGALKQQ
ncbi:hypothetical protein STEG23_002209 [Scotinomys teguina]